MTHPLEGMIREAYAAFARGDLDGYFRACSEDWNFNIAGQGAIAGTYRGKQGLYELTQKAMATTNGTFQEDVGRSGKRSARHRSRPAPIYTRWPAAGISHRPCIRDPRR